MLEIHYTLSKLSDYLNIPKKKLKEALDEAGVSPVDSGDKNDVYDVVSLQNLNFRALLDDPKDQVISIYNLKGGTGKSTISISLSLGLSLMGYKVLVLDMDDQRNLTNSILFNVPEDQRKGNVSDYFIGGLPLAECLTKALPNLDIMCGPDWGINFTQAILNSNKVRKDAVVEQVFKKDKLKEIYDFIIIDNPPKNDIGILNTLLVSDIVISPIEIQSYSFEGRNGVADTLRRIEEEYGLKIKHRTLINKYEAKNKSHVAKLSNLLDDYASATYFHCVAKNNQFVDAIDFKDFDFFGNSISYSNFKILCYMVKEDAVYGNFLSLNSEIADKFKEDLNKKVEKYFGQEASV